MAFNREAALAEGYTEDEINAYLQAEAEKKKQPTAPVVDVGDPPAPTTKIGTIESSPEAMATTTGLAVAPYAIPAAAAGAAALGGSKLYSSWKAGTEAAQGLANAKLASEAGIADREFVRQGVMTPQEALDRQNIRDQAIKAGKPAPVMPTGNASAVGPVNPATQPQPAQASMKSRVQAAAANSIKNLPGAGMMSQAGKIAGRVLPGAGTVLNAADAYNRAKEGDYGGAAIAGIGAAASPFPVVGTAVGMGAGALNAYLDYRKQQKEEEKKRMGQQ